MERKESFTIKARYLVAGEGWKVEGTTLEDVTFQQAGDYASKKARELDEKYGDDHFWTVDLYSVEHPEYGSYYQLFHGRLS